MREDVINNKRMTPVYIEFPNRATITVKGEDRRPFLQGLITQDINLLEKGKLLYSCLLTPQGKFLFDFFMREEDNTIFLDCEGGDRARELYKKLMMYKLRSKVDLAVQDPAPVFQIFDGVWQGDYPDPRKAELGYRTYEEPKTLMKVSFDIWDEFRIKHVIPDGSRDIIPEKSFIHEARLDELNAVSYKKGCYMGQELVSRMHHRGLAKKHLQCVDINAVPDGAELRSTSGQIGLALVKD